ncbi:MAG: glycosyltransferase family 2 protein [Thermoprotei archaeon]
MLTSDKISERFPLVSIVIINHNGIEHIQKCLESVFSTSYPNFEVILIDNASTDGSLALVKKLFGQHSLLSIIHNQRNLGLAEGRNIGVRHAKGKYVAFLDHDTKVTPEWLSELVKVMESNVGIGVAQCKFLLMDDPTCFDSAGHYIDLFGIGTIIGYLERDRGQYDHVYEIFGAQGGAFAIKRKLFNEIGGTDSDFFYLFEETDLCWRVWLAGYTVVFAPRAIVYHKGGGTARKIGNERIVYLFVRNRITSILKNYELMSLLKYLPIHLILMLGFSLVKIRKRRLKEAKAIVKAITWNLFNLRKIWQKRRRVQRMRKISDRFLIKRGIIRKPNICEIWKRAQG